MYAPKNPREFTGSRAAFEMLKRFSASGNQPRPANEIVGELMSAGYAHARDAELVVTAKGLNAARTCTMPPRSRDGAPQ